MVKRKLDPIHPGVVLAEAFLRFAESRFANCRADREPIEELKL